MTRQLVTHPMIASTFEVERLLARLQAIYGGQLLIVEHAADSLTVYLSEEADPIPARTLLEDPIPLSTDQAFIQADGIDTATITIDEAIAAPLAAVWLDEAPYMEEVSCPDGSLTLASEVPGHYRIEIVGDGRWGAITVVAQEVN